MEQPKNKRQRLGNQPPLQQTLVCSVCRAYKPAATAFSKNQSRKDAASRQCIECQNKPQILHCSGCKASKPATAFGKKQKLKDAASRQCTECLNIGLNTTRMCSNCNKSKVVAAFPKDGDQTKCLKCQTVRYRCSVCHKSLVAEAFPKDGDKKCQTERTPEEKVCKSCRIAQEERSALFRSFRQAKAKYDIPTWMWDIPVRSESVRQEIRLDDLVGEYDIVFLAVHSSDFDVQCTTQHQHRTLQLGLHPTKTGSLLGVVEKAPEGEGEGENGHVCLFDDKFSFETSADEESADTGIAALAFELVGELPFNFDGDGEVGGFIQVLDRIEACPWIPTANFELGRDAFLDSLAQLRFANVEAALAANREHSNFVPLWMENNIALPHNVPRMIYQFATDRPAAPPAFLFEPGDVLLRVNWDQDFREPFFSIQVARRRVDKN